MNKNGIPVVTKICKLNDEGFVCEVHMDDEGIYIPTINTLYHKEACANSVKVMYMRIPMEVLEDVFRLLYKKLKEEE